MRKQELKSALIKLGVPATLYSLDCNGRTDECFCLEFEAGKWNVYFRERGVKTTNEEFATEEEACQFIYEQFC